MAKYNSECKIVAVLVAISFMLSCSQKQPVKQLFIDYSYNDGWRNTYSMQVYENGQGVMKKAGLDSTWLFTNSNLNVAAIKSLVARVDEQKLAHRFMDERLQDGSAFNLYIYSAKEPPASYFVYGNKYPATLKNLQQYLFQLTRSKSWYSTKIDTVKYLSSKVFSIRPNVDSIKFPPGVK